MCTIYGIFCPKKIPSSKIVICLTDKQKLKPKLYERSNIYTIDLQKRKKKTSYFNYLKDYETLLDECDIQVWQISHHVFLKF